MKPAPFRYHTPHSVDEAVALLAEVAPNDGRVLAGGQSLVPMMALRLARPEDLVDINSIPELGRLVADSEWLSIGACVRHAAFHGEVVGNPLGTLLSEVANHIAHYPIRTRGTFCGSLAHADPSSEWCLVAAVLGAEIRAQSRRGTRTLATDAFFRGAMSTALAPDELLTAVRLPLLGADSVFGFYEFSRRAGDYALSAALAVYRIKDGVITEPRLALAGAENNPRRIAEAEAVLSGARPNSEIFREAASAAAEAIDPITDAQVSVGYRRKLVRTVCERALARTV
jgi:carbon-monoxide dehydrogenase medium subunit